MATQETVVDQKPVDLAPVDTNVVVPRHVQEAARLAESFYQPAQTPEQIEADRVAAEAAATEAARVAAEQNPNPPPTPQQHEVPQPSKDEVNSDTWAGRYNSMKGRWESSQRQVGSLQEQLIQMGDELGRVNALLSRAGVQTDAAPAAQEPQRGHDHNKLITDADRETYGDEFLDTVARAARGAVQPEIDTLKNENAELKKRVISDDQRALRTELARAVPNWSAIQKSPEWNRWLSLPNVYTGQVRGQMLRAAYGAANAPQVIALFQDFVKEVRATGGEVPVNQRQEQQAQPDPRTPALDLETLAAPGRARPAGGNDTQTPADKPIYTRAQIAGHYADRRRGYYNGHETKWAALDADMIAAGREGRVRG